MCIRDRPEGGMDAQDHTLPVVRHRRRTGGAALQSVFPDSRISDVARYGPAGPRPEGTVMTVAFSLDGQEFLALNGGPEYAFTEAISFQVHCATQEEVDHYWSKLSEGGEEGPNGAAPAACRPGWCPSRRPVSTESPRPDRRGLTQERAPAGGWGAPGLVGCRAG